MITPKNDLLMKTTHLALLFFGLWLTALSLPGLAQETQSCLYYVHPKIRVTNRQFQPMTGLTIAIKADGTDQHAITWNGHLEAAADTVLALSPLALHQGLHTLSLYTPDYSPAEVALEWADDRTSGGVSSPLPMATVPTDDLASGDDCTCMRAAEATFSQLNLWLYLTDVGSGQPDITGSIDQGHSWESSVPETPDQPCSDLRLTFGRDIDEEVQVRITTDTVPASVARTAFDGFADSENAESTSLTAYPNPFSEVVTIRYVLEAPVPVKGAVYSLQGHRVAILVDEAMQKKGTYEVTFRPGALPNGTYFYRLQMGEKTKTCTLIYQGVTFKLQK